MALAFIENGAITKHPISLVEIRRKFPNVSFQRNLENCDLSAFGVVTVQSTPSPSFDPNLQKVEAADPVEIDGVWQQAWSVVDLSAEEIQQRSNAEASGVRAQRNELLTASDWTQAADCELSDALKAEWVAYRQALRRVPEQAGFPWSIDWPSQP